MIGRLAEQVDLDVAVRALLALREKSPAAQMKYAKPEVATRNLKKMHTRIVSGYLIVFDIGSPWYTDERFLIEELILKIEKTDAPVSVAIDALSEIAKEFNCVAVSAGDTQIGYMVPHYHAAGFVTLGQQLIKELPHGGTPEMDGG